MEYEKQLDSSDFVDKHEGKKWEQQQLLSFQLFSSSIVQGFQASKICPHLWPTE
jgi:hypothetical protein